MCQLNIIERTFFVLIGSSIILGLYFAVLSYRIVKYIIKGITIANVL
jgi:hypothetical protein